MHFTSIHITGKGRGKGIGFPTINLKIPENFDLKDGVYATKVHIEGQSFIGAMHYGPIPVYNETAKSLEVFLLDVDFKQVPETENKKIDVEVKNYIREIRTFSSPIELSRQIAKDVEDIRRLI